MAVQDHQATGGGVKPRPEAVRAPGIHRRTIVKGAAWSLPAISMAIAVPMASASTTPVIEVPAGTFITSWRGDHHYGSLESDASQRSYDFTIVVKDSFGNPIEGATVTVVAAGRNSDGDLLSAYAYPAPDSAPNDNPHRTATAVTDPTGTARFAVNTQNLSSSEIPATATLTVSVTIDGQTTTQVVTVRMTASD